MHAGKVILVMICLFVAYKFMQYLQERGGGNMEGNSALPNQYQNPAQDVMPSDPNGNETFGSVQGIQTSMPTPMSSCANRGIQNPAELLPHDTNAQWAELNPSGKGELSNINLLTAGQLIGIDTVGQSLRNANLQLRSEPPNPIYNTGIWMQSTIDPPDNLARNRSFEIGNGPL